MKTSFWTRVRGGSSGVRILSTYVALVLMLAIAGPGLAAYATDQGSPGGAESVPPLELLPAEDPLVTTEPVEPEPLVLESGSEVPELPEPSIEMPMAVAFGFAPTMRSVPESDPNPNSIICAGGVKLDDSPRTGTYTPATSGTEETPTTPTDYVISIVTYQDPDGLGMLMDFESNYPVSQVTVKGGTPSEVYTYDPPVYSGVGLHSPVNDNNGKYFDISHIVFCFGEEQPPVLSDLTVYKFEDLNSNGEFDDEPMLAGWEFTLYDSEDAVVGSGTTDVNGMVVFSDLTPGDYYATETLKPGWTSTTGLTHSIALPSETPWLYFGNIGESLPFTELDLAIAKLADKETASEGELITYTLTYRNLGELAAENFTIVDDFDERYVTVVNAAGGVVAGGKITWTLAGPLTVADGPKTITYTVRVIADMPSGTTNVDNVVVIGHPRDTNAANNTASERVIVRVADEPFLPFTGGEYLLLIGFAIAAAGLGLKLRMRTADLS